MAKKSIIILAILFFILIVSVFKLYTTYRRPLTHQLNADMQIVGILDTDKSSEKTLTAILNGEDSVLVVDHTTTLYQDILHKIPQATYLNKDEIFNVNNLHLFDKDAHNFITPKDPLFAHLFIITFYSNGNQNDIKSLSNAGVRGIHINQSGNGNASVLMSDGSERTLYNMSQFEKNN